MSQFTTRADIDDWAQALTIADFAHAPMIAAKFAKALRDFTDFIEPDPRYDALATAAIASGRNLAITKSCGHALSGPLSEFSAAVAALNEQLQRAKPNGMAEDLGFEI